MFANRFSGARDRWHWNKFLASIRQINLLAFNAYVYTHTYEYISVWIWFRASYIWCCSCPSLIRIRFSLFPDVFLVSWSPIIRKFEEKWWNTFDGAPVGSYHTCKHKMMMMIMMMIILLLLHYVKEKNYYSIIPFFCGPLITKRMETSFNRVITALRTGPSILLTRAG